MNTRDNFSSLSEPTMLTTTAAECSLADESLVQNLCEEDDDGDIMVEVVGSEVLVNGVSSEGGSWNWDEEIGSMEKDMENIPESTNMIEYDVEEGESIINLKIEKSNSNKRKYNLMVPLSTAEILSLLHHVAVEPKKAGRDTSLSSISTFFSDFRNSISVHFPRRQNACSSKKRKASRSPEAFVYDEVNDSYWAERTVENGSGELLSADKCIVDDNKRRAENGPAELVLNFCESNVVPVKSSLNKMFKRFGPLQELATEVDRERWRARVVFKRWSDAEVALSSAGVFNIFGPVMVNYQLNYIPSIPLPLLDGQDDATLLTSSRCC